MSARRTSSRSSNRTPSSGQKEPDDTVADLAAPAHDRFLAAGMMSIFLLCFYQRPLELANGNVTPAVAGAVVLPWPPGCWPTSTDGRRCAHAVARLVGAGLISSTAGRSASTARRSADRGRPLPLCGLGLTLTFVGIFFRGPGYSFVIPYLPFFENSSSGLHFAL
jgi:hypothetical protein